MVVSSSHLTLPGDDDNDAATAASIDRLSPRSGSSPAASRQGSSDVASGISPYDSAPTAGRTAYMAMGQAAPSCVRQEMTPMTLIGLLLRGMANGNDGPQRPTLHPFGGTGWGHLGPELPPLDVAGARRLHPSRDIQHLLQEVVQIVAGDLPTDGASSSRDSNAPQ
jgi:hypothetical protein